MAVIDRSARTRRGLGALLRTLALAALVGIAATLPAAPAADAVVHGAYFYDYMPIDHLDSLAAAGFDRALVHLIPDTLSTAAATALAARVDRGRTLGVEVVPEWLLQSRARLAQRPASRRYTWGKAATAESTVACPLDSLYWRAAMLDRAEQVLAGAPATRRLAVDLEVLDSGRHHYDAGPCVCPSCRLEYAHGDPTLAARDPARLSGLGDWEQARVTRIVRGLLAEFAGRHPGVELGVLDLDFVSLVHRGVASAFARSHVPTVDYTEKSYGAGVAALAGARARLDALGLKGTPLVGGLWLKRFGPAELADSIVAIDHRFDGTFLFTTYSLWQPPAKLSGPYTLQASAGDYWRAIRRAFAAR